MEAILELTNLEVMLRLSWKHMFAGGVLVVLLICLYLCANQMSDYSEVGEKGEISSENGLAVETPNVISNGNLFVVSSGFSDSALKGLGINTLGLSKVLSDDSNHEASQVIISDGAIVNKAVLDYRVSKDTITCGNIGMSDSSTEKENAITTLKVTVYGNGGTPDMAESTYAPDAFCVDDIAVPLRLGKLFVGWYLDADCTIPFTDVGENCTAVQLYAGWKEFPGFLSNEAGHIIGYTDRSVVRIEGLLILPHYEECTGVERYAFSGIEEDIIEIYIPANIQYIASGAFDDLKNLIFIEAASGNSYYYSKNGILYNMDGTIAFYPKGREEIG